jgi:hypothetical protein
LVQKRQRAAARQQRHGESRIPARKQQLQEISLVAFPAAAASSSSSSSSGGGGSGGVFGGSAATARERQKICSLQQHIHAGMCDRLLEVYQHDLPIGLEEHLRFLICQLVAAQPEMHTQAHRAVSRTGCMWAKEQRAMQ